METQAKLAERWRTSGLFPYAQDAGAGRQGNDILNTPGLSVEVKARDTVSLVAALKQADQDNLVNTPIVVWRHNGQGLAKMGEWTVTMRLDDFERLWECFTDANC